MSTVLNTTTGIWTRRPLAGRETEVTATAMSTAHVTWIVNQIQKRPPLLAAQLTSQDCCVLGCVDLSRIIVLSLLTSLSPSFLFSLSPCLALHWSHSQVHLRTWGAKVGPIFWRIYTCRISWRRPSFVLMTMLRFIFLCFCAAKIFFPTFRVVLSHSVHP